MTPEQFASEFAEQDEHVGVTPLVAKIKGQDELFLSFDPELVEFLKQNQKQDYVNDVVAGNLLMVVEYEVESGKYVDAAIQPFKSSDEGNWWSFVTGESGLVEIYREHRSEFDLVEELYEIGIEYSSTIETLKKDQAMAKRADFLRRFANEYPDDEDKTVDRLSGIFRSITDSFFAN